MQRHLCWVGGGTRRRRNARGGHRGRAGPGVPQPGCGQPASDTNTGRGPAHNRAPGRARHLGRLHGCGWLPAAFGYWSCQLESATRPPERAVQLLGPGIRGVGADSSVAGVGSSGGGVGNPGVGLGVRLLGRHLGWWGWQLGWWGRQLEQWGLVTRVSGSRVRLLGSATRVVGRQARLLGSGVRLLGLVTRVFRLGFGCSG